MKIGAAALLAWTLTLLNVSSTTAEEWRYCLGVSSQQKIYLSEPFQTSQPYQNVEYAFQQALDANSLEYVSIQCPLSGSAQHARLRRVYTIEFNHSRGFNVVKFPWRPAPGSAGR